MKQLQWRCAVAAVILWLVPLQARAVEMLVPGGQAVALELGESWVSVADFDQKLGQAAREAGLKAGDILTKINDTAITAPGDVTRALNRSDGTVLVTVLRQGKTHQLRLTPQITQDGPRLGVFLRQGVTGVGTITYYDPDTGEFAALGHGVSSPKGGLLDLTQGHIYPARVLSVRKGKVGQPGQLLGTITSPEPIGTLVKNTPQGVFGTWDGSFPGEALPVGDAASVRTGPATILSTVDDGKPRSYAVEILKIYTKTPSDSHNLLIRVTDPALLEATGGIVQGLGVRYNRDNTGNP